MVRKAFDSTVASSDFYTVFDSVVASNPQLNKVITEVRNESNLFLVRVLRFYTIRDMAYVEELDSGRRYYCYLTHEMLSYEVSLNCMCDGTVESDSNYGTYVKPFSRIYGIVADVRFKGNTDEKCLLACLNYDNDNQLKSNVRNGEIKLVSGESTLSISRNRINLTTPRLFVNGLPYDEPKLANYYDKTEINTIKSDTDAQIDELVEDVNTQIGEIDDKVSELTNMIYPVGSIYMSVTNTNPSLLFGGEWEQIKDKFLLSCGNTYTNGSTGGSATVSLTQSQMPRHNHTTNAHHHSVSESGEYFVTSEANGANNTRVSYNASGNRYVDGMTTDSTPFHHRTSTGSASPTTKYTGGSGTSESASNGSAHENMPPFLAVYVWKRIG